MFLLSVGMIVHFNNLTIHVSICHEQYLDFLMSHWEIYKWKVSGDLVLIFLVVRHFQEYVEPDENSQTVTSPPRRNAPNPLGSTGDSDHVLLPLDESTLTHNLGIPIVVAITKVCTNRGIQFHIDGQLYNYDNHDCDSFIEKAFSI